MFMKKEFTLSLAKYKDIMIFGAKEGAQNTYKVVKNEGFDIKCFIVSKRLDNPYVLDQKPVKVFSDISTEDKKNSLVIISQIYEKNNEMRKILYQEGFKNVIASSMQYTPFWKSISEHFVDGLYIVKGDFKKKTKTDLINVSIYAVTSHKNLHKGKGVYKSKYVKYIQAGAKLTDTKICDITDDKGDNISEQNAYFCELTAGYWVYKNDLKSDYIGLYHYSRGLEISDTQIEDIVASGVDVVLPNPYIFRYNLFETTEDVEIMMESINNVCPEYVDLAEDFFQNKEFFPGNIVFAKREIFCKYYEWMFDVLGECKKIKKTKGELVEKRLWGHYAEYLTGIYFKYHMDEYERVLYSKIKYLY